MFLFNKCLIEDFGFMMKGIQNGLLSVERVDQAVTRILATKAALQLHKINPNDALDISRVGHAENFEKSRECADKSITLVKDTLNLLPLSLDKQKKIKMIYVGDKTDMFGFPTPTYETLRSKLIAEGFEVDVYDTSVFNMRDMMLSVEEFVADYDMVLYACQIKTASNKTSLRINWTPPMGVDAPWFTSEIPTAFVSFGNPYHLMDVPGIHTFVNAYASNNQTIDAVVEKLMGRSEFTGISPVDAFAGLMDTHF